MTVFLAEEGAGMVGEVLPQLQKYREQAWVQDEREASKAPLIKDQGDFGRLRWERQTATQIVRLFNAIHGSPIKPKSKLSMKLGDGQGQGQAKSRDLIIGEVEVYERGKDAQMDGCVDQLEEWGAQVPVGAMHWRKKQDWVLVRCAEGSWAVVRSLQLGGEKGMSSAREFCAKQLKGKAYKPSDKEFRYICGGGGGGQEQV